MATVAHVDARFTADTGDFVRSVRSAQQAASNFSQGMDGVSDSVAGIQDSTKAASGGFTVLKGALSTALGVGAVDMVKNAIGAVKGFAKSAMDTAARVEELDIAMKAIGESTGVGYKAINEASKAIRANGIEMAAAQQIAIEFAQNQLDLASASQVARVAQDLAVIGGKNSTATTQLLTRAIITGNSMLLKSAGISKTASEGYAEYAESIGKGARQLNALERQQAITNLIIDEGSKVAGTYEASMNAAGKVLRSFPRIFNDIKVEVGGVLTQAFGPMIKSTYDLVSSFSKALREGGSLSGMLESVTEVLVKMTEPMVAVIDHLTEMVKSGEMFDRVTEVIKSGLPIFLALAEASRAFSEVLISLAVPALKAVLDSMALVLRALTPLLNLFLAMPDVVKLAVGALIFLQTALGTRLAAALVVANTRVKAWSVATLNAFRTVGHGAAVAASGVAASMMSKKIAMEMALISAKKMGMGMVAAFRMAGVAAKGLLASLGPVGIALAVAAVAFEVFAGKSAHAEAMVSELKDTVDETTGAFTEMSAAMVASQIRSDLSQDTIDHLARLGITVTDMTAAILEGGEAAAVMEQRLISLIQAGEGQQWGGLDNWIETVRRNYTGLVEVSGETRTQIENDAKAKADAEEYAARQIASSNEAIQFSHRAAADAQRRELAAMTGSERARYEASRAAARQEAENQSMLQRVTEATRVAVISLKQAYDDLTSVFSETRAADRAHDAHAAMLKQLKSNKDGIEGYSGAARANRDAVLDYAEAQVAYAKSLEDPQRELDILMKTQREVREQLKEQGIKPKDSALYQSIKGSVQAAKEAVDDMKDAVSAAEDSGLDVAQAIAEGITAGMSEQESAINAAGVLGGEVMSEGVFEGIDARSPSRKAIEAAGRVGEGLVVGLSDMHASVRSAATVLGNELINGLVNTVNAGKGRVSAAVRGLVSAGLAAGREAAEVRSPSRVTMRLGNQIARGLAIGISMSSGEAAISMRNMVTKALDAGRRAALEYQWNLADARDSLAGAEKSLREAIKEGDAREIARARRDVARAKIAVVEAKAAQDLERLDKLQDRFEKLWDRIQKIRAAREDGRQSLISLFRRRFGEPSEWQDFNQAAGMATRDAINMFDRLENVIKQRFAGIKGGQRSELLKLLRSETRALVRLIRERDEVLKQLEVANINLTRAKESQAEVAALMREPLGEPSELQKALNTANMTVDSVIALYDRLSAVIEKRFTSAVRDSDGNIVEQFSDTGKALLASLEAESRRLVALVKRRDDVLARLAEAEKKLDELTQQRNNMAKTVRDSIANIFKSDTSVGSAELYIRGLNQRLDATRDFIRGIEKLRSRGLEEGLLRELTEAGPERGRALVAALSGATDAQLDEINRLRSAGDLLADTYSEYVADVTYGDEIESALDAVSKLRVERDNILQEMADIVAGIEKTMADLAASTGEGSVDAAQAIVDGLESKYDEIIAAMENITQGLFDTLSPLTDASFDIGKGAADNLLLGLQKRARKLLEETQRIAQAIANMMAEAMGTKAPTIKIPAKLMKDLQVAESKKKSTPAPIPNASTRPSTVISSGAVQVKVDIAGTSANAPEISAAVQNAVRQALEQVARDAANARR